MRVVTFRGEESVAAIAEKVYTDLSPESLEVAEAALLEANPQLKHLEDVEAGTVLRVADVAGLEPRSGSGLDDPVGELGDMLVEQLDAYAEQLARRHEAHQAELKSQAALLKDQSLRKAVAASPALQRLAEQISEQIRARSKAATASLTRFEAALEKLKADLTKR